MKDFAHISASSVDHALSVLQDHGQGAYLMAGGQDLLFRIKKYIVQPTCVVDLKTIPGMKSITFASEGSLRIGSLVTLSEIAFSPDIRKHYTVLAGSHVDDRIIDGRAPFFTLLSKEFFEFRHQLGGSILVV